MDSNRMDIKMLRTPWILLALLSGCPSSTETIAASEFDQSCSVPSDCTAVKEGPKCCPLDPATINKADVDAFVAEGTNVYCSSEDDSCFPVVKSLRPTCTDGACVLTDEECEVGTACVGIDP
jgi:hypothetical protein